AFVESVEIDVGQQHTPVHLVDQAERWASHSPAHPEPSREAGHEAGLARAERSMEQHHVSQLQCCGEAFTPALRLLGRLAPAREAFGVRRAHVRRGVSVTSGSTISSIEMPPCWNEPRNWRSYSWKRVG